LIAIVLVVDELLFLAKDATYITNPAKTKETERPLQELPNMPNLSNPGGSLFHSTNRKSTTSKDYEHPRELLSHTIASRIRFADP